MGEKIIHAIYGNTEIKITGESFERCKYFNRSKLNCMNIVLKKIIK